jgi:hypothetical protein
MTPKTVKTLAIVCTLAGLVGVGVQFLPARRVPEQPATATKPVQPVTQNAATGGTVNTMTIETPAPVDTAALAEDPRVKQVNTPAELAKYFEELETNARKNGKVTDEMARASEAGKRLIATMGGQNVARKMFDFGDRMRQLSFELKWQPVQNELASLRDRLAKEPNPAAREKIIAEYNAASAKLPAAGKMAAAQKLKQTLEGS